MTASPPAASGFWRRTVAHLIDLGQRIPDDFVMGAWARDQGTEGKIRMIADGAADWTRKLGLDTSSPALGVRSKRHSMLVEDGVIKALNVEQPGKFEVSDAATMVKQA